MHQKTHAPEALDSNYAASTHWRHERRFLRLEIARKVSVPAGKWVLIVCRPSRVASCPVGVLRLLRSASSCRPHIKFDIRVGGASLCVRCMSHHFSRFLTSLLRRASGEPVTQQSWKRKRSQDSEEGTTMKAVPAKENKTPFKRPGGESATLMTQSTRKRAKAEGAWRRGVGLSATRALTDPSQPPWSRLSSTARRSWARHSRWR